MVLLARVGAMIAVEYGMYWVSLRWSATTARVENGGPSSNGLIAEAGLPGQLGRGTTSWRQDDDQDRKQPAPG